MCAFLYFSQSTWTIAGLILDIAGFALVAKNWNAVYWRITRKSNDGLLDQALRLAIELKSKAPLVEPGADASPIDHEIYRSRQEFRDFDFRYLRAAFLVAGTKSDGDEIERIIRDPTKTQEDLAQFVNAAKSEANSVFEKWAGEPFDLSSLAFLLIVGGFVLQLIGALPCS